MSSDEEPRGRSPGSIRDRGIQHENSTWNEASALLPGREIYDSVEEPWSKRSLAPGFIWIETGTAIYPYVQIVILQIQRRTY